MKIITLALIISLLSCENKSNKENDSNTRIKSKVTVDYSDNNNDDILQLLYGDSLKPKQKRNPIKKKSTSSDTIYISADEYSSEADLYLKMKSGKTYIVERKNDLEKTKSKSSKNKKKYSTEGIEYLEEWRIKAYKTTEEYLIKQFPIDNKGCNITNVGLYRPHNVKYIGSHSFQVKIYIIFECNNDSYRHKKNIWMEAYYWDDDDSFGFSLIKDRYVD